jgi:hypothetical protein
MGNPVQSMQLGISQPIQRILDFLQRMVAGVSQFVGPNRNGAIQDDFWTVWTAPVEVFFGSCPKPGANSAISIEGKDFPCSQVII